MNEQELSKTTLTLISQSDRKAVTRSSFDALVKYLEDDNIKAGAILQGLLESGKLVRYDFPFLNRKKIVFALKKTPLVALILEISENAYISHGTAAALH